MSTIYSPEQRILLEKGYQKCKNPSFDEKKRIGRELSVDVIKIHIWFANRRKRKNDSLIERENTRLNQNKNSSENSFSTQPSESENHIFDQNLNGLAPKHHPSINIDDEVLQSQQNMLNNNKTSVFVDSTIETPINNDLFTYEDSDNLIGDTSLFPEIFNDSGGSFFVEKYE